LALRVFNFRMDWILALIISVFKLLMEIQKVLSVMYFSYSLMNFLYKMLFHSLVGYEG
jgi:hypothetical protein